MKKSRFTDSQFMAVMKPAEGGTPIPEKNCCPPTGPAITSFRFILAFFSDQKTLDKYAPPGFYRRRCEFLQKFPCPAQTHAFLL